MNSCQGFVIDEPPWMVARGGWVIGAWFISTMLRDTETSEYRERPTRSYLTSAERGNPVAVLNR